MYDKKNLALSRASFDADRYAGLYKQELLDNVLPFWMKHSLDRRYGGYHTCLARDGRVYDTDKFIWLQGRQVWCFAFMYREVEAKPEWLEAAILGADFLEKYGRDAQGNWYFSLTEDGRPLVQPYNIFSDCFATMAFSALYRIKPEPRYKDIALQTFHNILLRQGNWKGVYNKSYPGTRELENFSLPMILCNLALEMEPIMGSSKVEELIPGIIKTVMDKFYQPSLGLILENIRPDGTMSNSFEGRLTNPGHAIEAMWFMMDIGRRINDPSLILRAKDIVLNTLEYAWDKEYGGVYYFLDVKGNPPQQLEWNHKLWWVHAETLVALAKAYTLTGDEACAAWFEKVHHYTWSHFRDEEYGEWFGYLDRRGDVQLDLKGGKWKGCFHIPRSLFQVWKTLASHT